MCTRPLIRAETFESYINKQGAKSYKCEWLQRDFYDECMKTESGQKMLKYKYRRVTPVPCGKCIECKLNYSRQWATDCMLEKQYYNENECWFLTLTYSDEYLPQAEFKTDTGESFKGISLRKKDLQDFWKRLRKHYTKNKIKYLAVGEYGKSTSRPHYHAIVYGLNLDTKKLKYLNNNENGDSLWTHPDIENIWGKGQIVLGQVTWKSIAYVARYTLKKQKDKDIALDQRYGRIPPFICMSQGIGKRYYEEHQKDLVSQDAFILPNGQYPLTKRFMRNLKVIDEELYTTLSESHKQYAEEHQKQLALSTDLNQEEIRQNQNLIGEKNFKDIRR